MVQEILEAARLGHTEKIIEYFEKHNTINICDKDGKGIFSYALQFHKTEKLKELLNYLLDRDVDVTKVGKDGKTVFHYAYGWGNEVLADRAFFEELKRRGVDINAKDGLSKTALDYAVERGRRKSVSFLLRNDAYPSISSESLLVKAAEKGHTKIVRMLARHMKIEEFLKDGLSKAAEKGHIKMVMLLARYMKMKGKMEEFLKYGKMALAAAEKGGFVEVGSFLIGEGVVALDIDRFFMEKIDAFNQRQARVIPAAADRESQTHSMLQLNSNMEQLPLLVSTTALTQAIPTMVDRGWQKNAVGQIRSESCPDFSQFSNTVKSLRRVCSSRVLG